MARILAASLVVLSFCACALIAAADEPLDFRLFDAPVAAVTPATDQPLEFRLFDSRESRESLDFTMFHVPAEARQPRARQVLHFTAEWCTACQRTRKTIDALKAAGWDVGEHETAAIRIVDFDKHPELAKAHLVYGLPHWTALRDGKESDKFVGYLDPHQVARLYRQSHLHVAAR